MTKVLMIDGLPVVDAKRPITLHVTRGDIAKAANSAKKPDKCAVARACLREFHAKDVRVHVGRTYVRLNDHNWTRYITPDRFRAEIISLDRGGTFEPCQARLLPVYQSKKKPSHQGSAEKPKARSKLAGRKSRLYRVNNVRASPVHD